MQQAAAQDSGSGMYGIYGTQLQQHQQMQPGWGQGWGMPMGQWQTGQPVTTGQPTTVMQPGATVSKPARPGGGFDPPPPPRITEFYHGTSVEAAMSIQANGFDVSRSGSNAGAMLGPGLYVTTTLQKAIVYATGQLPDGRQMSHRPHGGAVFKLKVDLGNCYTVEQNDPYMSTWQQKGYDSAWSADGVNGKREEHCIKDPRPPRVQILDVILANTRTASEGGFIIENGRIEQRGTMGQPEGLKREPSSNQCVICMDKKATHAVVPCGHQCLCPDCALFVEKCPMCRVAKQCVIKIFR